MKTVNPTDVIVNQRARKHVGWLDTLERSIQQHGLLQPIGITPDNVLVFGERRLKACINLGMTEIACRVVDVDPNDPASFLRMERDENTERKDFTPEERVAIGQAIEGGLTGRQGQRTDLEHPANLPEVAKGESRELAAAAVGMSTTNYRKAKTVFSEADAATKEEVNSGKKSIHKAYTETKKTKAEAEPSRTWKFTLDFDSDESLTELADKIVEEVDMDKALSLAERILSRYGKLEVTQ